VCASVQLLRGVLCPRAAAPGSTLFPYTTLFRSALLAAVESRSEHPIARAIVAAAEAEGIAVPPLADFESVTGMGVRARVDGVRVDRKSTRLNSSHVKISYAVFCLKKKSRSSETT